MSDQGDTSYVVADEGEVGSNISVPFLFQPKFEEAGKPINVIDHNHPEHLYIQNETDWEDLQFKVFRNFRSAPKSVTISDTELESTKKSCFSYGAVPKGRSVIAVETNNRLALKLTYESRSSSNNSHNVVSVSSSQQSSANGGTITQTAPISLDENESGNFVLNVNENGKLWLTRGKGERQPQTIRIEKNPKSYDVPVGTVIWYELVNFVKTLDEATGEEHTEIISVLGPFYTCSPTYNLLLTLTNNYIVEFYKSVRKPQGSTSSTIKNDIVFAKGAVFAPGQAVTIFYKDIQKNEMELQVNSLTRMQVTINYKAPVEGVDDEVDTY